MVYLWQHMHADGLHADAGVQKFSSGTQTYIVHLSRHVLICRAKDTQRKDDALPLPSDILHFAGLHGILARIQGPLGDPEDSSTEMR